MKTEQGGTMRIFIRRHGAAIAILILLLASVRTLGEVYRLHLVRGADFTLADAFPYINGGIMATVGAEVAFGFYAWNHHKAAIAVVGVTILMMLGYKVMVIGW